MGIQISKPFRGAKLKPKLGMQGGAENTRGVGGWGFDPVALLHFKSGLAPLNQI